tara:strand:- start:8689 stop:9459 length:771 start_codon:yes stop_codon:yes gene_type:complete
MELQRLKIESEPFGTREGIEENIQYALSLGLPKLIPAICANDGTFVVVGSGPTVKDFVEEIREEKALNRPICGVKGAYDFLVENEITPHFYLSVEPRDRPLLHPQKDSLFLVASRCHPNMFKKLKDYQVLVWNAWGGEFEQPFYENDLAYGGGSTSGLRAISIGYILGFRKFHLYGFDSCLIGGEKRIGQGDVHGDIKTMSVIVGGKHFTASIAMAEQANTFQEIYEYVKGITIKSFGDGLITAIIAERKRMGLVT